jgi:hypothetical protein
MLRDGMSLDCQEIVTALFTKSGAQRLCQMYTRLGPLRPLHYLGRMPKIRALLLVALAVYAMAGVFLLSRESSTARSRALSAVDAGA